MAMYFGGVALATYGLGCLSYIHFGVANNPLYQPFFNSLCRSIYGGSLANVAYHLSA